jgi:hypothetical protein
MAKVTPGRHEEKRDKPADVRQDSEKSYRPGYGLDTSLKEASEDDMLRGYQRGENR